MKKRYLLAIVLFIAMFMFGSNLPMSAQRAPVTDLLHARDTLRETEQRLQQAHDATQATIDVMRVQMTSLEMRLSAIDSKLEGVKISIIETDEAIRAIH